jgi:hypothetical protein
LLREVRSHGPGHCTGTTWAMRSLGIMELSNHYLTNTLL